MLLSSLACMLSSLACMEDRWACTLMHPASMGDPEVYYTNPACMVRPGVCMDPAYTERPGACMTSLSCTSQACMKDLRRAEEEGRRMRVSAATWEREGHYTS